MHLLVVILWKNLLLRRNQYIVTTLEVLIPIVAVVLCCLIPLRPYSELTSVHSINDVPRSWEPNDDQQTFQFSSKNDEWCHDVASSSILYTPSNAATDETVETLIREANKVCRSGGLIWQKESFQNENDMEERFLNRTYPEPKAGLVFLDGLKYLKGSENDVTFPYKIRMNAWDTPSTKKLLPGVGDKDFKRVGPITESAKLYYDNGFLRLQYNVDAALTKLHTNQNRTSEITLESFPYPPYQDKLEQLNASFIKYLLFMLPLALSFMIPTIIRNVIGEKQTGIAELLKLCGVPGQIQLLGWIINSLVPALLTITACVVILYNFKVPISYGLLPDVVTQPQLVYSDWTLIWMIFFLYIMSIIAMCIFISALFKNAALATSITLLFWIVTATVPYLSTNCSLPLLLIPNSAFQYAMYHVIKLEILIQDDSDEPLGAQWSWTLMNVVHGEDSAVPMFQILLMMAGNIFLYLLLATYLNGVFPGQFGIARPFYWFNISCPKNPQLRVSPTQASLGAATYNTIYDNSITESNVESNEANDITTSFEPEPDGRMVGIEIRNLYKKFGGKVAVNNVSMKLYSGDIFALLGHNGAGKTTLISMLTGFFSPTRGTTIVNGHDMAKDVDNARKNMGFCPQHNMLFNALSVSQQMTIFGMLKGQSYSKANMETNMLISKMTMMPQKSTLAKNLSGGQMRKLSLGLAILGGSKVIILDEVTSGIDAQSRREIWDLLLELRQDRTILLTTHFMEEADALGDRIGIMAHGELQCCGSPAFLKKYYGTGYTLKLTLLTSISEIFTDENDAIDSKHKKTATALHPATTKILAIIQNHLPNATPKTNTRNNADEFFITLPSETSTTAALSEMFTDLTANKSKLSIQTMGLSQTTMDEVFLRVGELVGHEYLVETSVFNDDVTTAPKTARYRTIRELLNLSRKRLIYHSRKWTSLLFLILLVILLAVGATVLIQFDVVSERNTFARSCVQSFSGRQLENSRSSVFRVHDESDGPQLLLNLDKYEDSVTYFSATGDESESTKTAVEYAIGPSKKIGLRNKQDFQQEIINVGSHGKGGRQKYKRNHIVAVHVDGKEIVGMYNAFPYHAAPLAMNIAANTILKSLAPGPGASPRIQVYNQPFSNAALAPSNIRERKLTNDDYGRSGIGTSNDDYGRSGIGTSNDDYCICNSQPIKGIRYGLTTAMLSLLGVLLLTSYLIIFPIEERICQVKQLQLMTGVQPVIYWGSAFLIDYGLYFVVVCLMLICLTVTEFTWPAVSFLGVNGGTGLCVLLVILMSYGFSCIPLSYLLSFRYSTAVSGYSAFLLIQLGIGIIVGVIVVVLEAILYWNFPKPNSF